MTVTATLGAPPPSSTSHDADDHHHHHLGNHGNQGNPAVLRATGASTAEPVTTEAFVHLEDTDMPATPYLEPAGEKSEVTAAAEALEKRLESEAATYNFSGVNYANVNNNDVNGYHKEYHVSQEELASMQAVEMEEAEKAAEEASTAAKVSV